MTAEIINLNRVRKARERADKERQATLNRAKYGQPKAERERGEAERLIDDKRLDGAKRGTADDGSDCDPEALS